MPTERHSPEYGSDQNSDCWPQLLIEWTSWATAEGTAATRLLPVLTAAERQERLGRWFVVRKHPHWRLRYAGDTSVRAELVQLLQEWHSSGDVAWWGHGLYEPEVLAFGGPAAMRTAHALFHTDSHHMLAYLARQNTPASPHELGRRELGVLLTSTLLRGAEQDWYEQGDVWHRIAAHRRTSTNAHSPVGDRQRTRIRRLMTVDTTRADGTTEVVHDWLHAFTTAGQELADHALHGRLERGLRAILAHHTLFAFNRLGLPAHEQVALAELATDVVMNNNSLSSSGPCGDDSA